MAQIAAQIAGWLAGIDWLAGIGSVAFALACITATACHGSAPQQAPQQPQQQPVPMRPFDPGPNAHLAFPGAEGFGRFAKGGRGGKIIAVTTLADAGPGSLRACIDAMGPRVCVFRVAGVIRYTTIRPIIRNPYITIAGETAPGDGILITHAGGKDGLTPFVIKNTHDVIVRHIRVRTDLRGWIRASNSGFIIENSHDVIFDHVSGSWALDENIGSYAQADRFTIQWSIFAEGTPRHDKCALLASDPKAPQDISFVHNLCAHNGDRNPDVNVQPGSCVEVLNNVMYNANNQYTEIWESNGGSPVNVVGNVYLQGPSTSSISYAIDRPLVASLGMARIYAADNWIQGDRLQIPPVTRQALVDKPVCPFQSHVTSAKQAYDDVLNGSGAFPRDTVDQRIVQEVRTRKGKIGRDNHVLPVLAPGTPYPDRDGDGMSDAWEIAHGLNPDKNDAWGDADGDGWTNLENFLDYAHHQRMRGLPVG